MIARAESPIYLDYQSTTPCDARVLEAMLPWFTQRFGNPHSVNHSYGRDAHEGVETARAEIAAIIGAEANEIVFVSGATEANNLAIKGAAAHFRGEKTRVVVASTEHRAVLDTCQQLERQGIGVTWLPVRRDGLVDLDELQAAVTPQTALVSIMAVNNEIGIVQPLAEIGALCRAAGVLFHTDAAQAVGKIALDVEAMAIDLLSISGHKIYGPKGIGALYVRRRPRRRLAAQIHGGGQERGLRAGTLPTPLCVGLGEACRIARIEVDEESRRLDRLRNRLLDGLRQRVPEFRVNGDLRQRVAGNLNLSFFGIETSGLLADLQAIAVSASSACSSDATEPSHVLRALGVALDGWGSIRIGLGRFTTEDEVDAAIEELARSVSRLRDLSPVWEMYCDGVDLTSSPWTASRVGVSFMQSSANVLTRFAHPTNAGHMDDPSVGVGIVGAPSCGAVVRLEIKGSPGGLICAARFKAFGGPSTIATASYACEWLEGKTLCQGARIEIPHIAGPLELAADQTPFAAIVVEAVTLAIEDYLRRNSAGRDAASARAAQIVDARL
jgi:cysteine desulfurase